MITITLTVTPEQMVEIAEILLDSEIPPVTISGPTGAGKTVILGSDTPPEPPVTDIPPPPDETVTDTPPPPDMSNLAKGQKGQMIPWDERIHATSKSINADGTWRLKQKVDKDTLVPMVEAELAASVPPPPPPSTDGKPSTFGELLPVVTKMKADGALTDEMLASACEKVGLTQFGQIAVKPELIPQFVEALGL